jgi:hypothetical protein
MLECWIFGKLGLEVGLLESWVEKLGWEVGLLGSWIVGKLGWEVEFFYFWKVVLGSWIFGNLGQDDGFVESSVGRFPVSSFKSEISDARF